MRRVSDKKKILPKVLFGNFFSCPQCGRAIVGEMRKYFICSRCGRALCGESELESFDENYCGNCGYELTSAKEKALALLKEDN